MMQQSIAVPRPQIQVPKAIAQVFALPHAQEAIAFMDQFNFDMNNHYHSSMRRLMVDTHSRHTQALNDANPISAARYRGMAQCLERVSLLVLNDSILYHACSELTDELESQHQQLMEGEQWAP